MKIHLIFSLIKDFLTQLTNVINLRETILEIRLWPYNAISSFGSLIFFHTYYFLDKGKEQV